jgi:hypothetical protein
VRYDVAMWDEESRTAKGRIRFGMPTGENEAAHRAVHYSRELQHHMCVVEEKTDEVVQVVRYFSHS